MKRYENEIIDLIEELRNSVKIFISSPRDNYEVNEIFDNVVKRYRGMSNEDIAKRLWGVGEKHDSNFYK